MLEKIFNVALILTAIIAVLLLVGACAMSVHQDSKDTSTCLAAGYAGWKEWNGERYCIRMEETAPVMVPITEFQE